MKQLQEKTLQELISLKGKTAVVTGGASGIGFAISKRLAEAGANVIIADLNEEAATKVAKELSETYNTNNNGLHLNVKEPDSIVALVQKSVELTGRLDIWVNNAGIYPSKPILEINNDEWDLVHDLNLKGTFIGAREAAKVMIEKDIKGVIINLASTAAFNASNGANPAHYVSSKHGVSGLTKSLAVELGPKGIRAVAVAPTLTETGGVELKRKNDLGMDAALNAYAQNIPLGRLGKPDDIAKTVLFAASELASFVTGSTLLADGGDIAR
ncbi:SDR family NAD(P)-dependent oxidoreductase [Bacillus sp. UNC41MFS5]|uniref:SDR family NAD(P)-dependent oxidoreductase n=1 Tax=Bacillus sp. UNC41MFS5 TaxID=1449046 RepID=UPI00047C75A8|nr:SDR family NAD(P)-dependent oxidoreductase [Bacillus sp. UNC41MFS5]